MSDHHSIPVYPEEHWHRPQTHHRSLSGHDLPPGPERHDRLRETSADGSGSWNLRWTNSQRKVNGIKLFLFLFFNVKPGGRLQSTVSKWENYTYTWPRPCILPEELGFLLPRQIRPTPGRRQGWTPERWASPQTCRHTQAFVMWGGS